MRVGIAKLANRRREPGREHRGRSVAERSTPCDAGRGIARRCLGFGRRAEDRAGPHEEFPAGLRQMHTPLFAHEQCRAQLTLQGLDLRRKRWLRNVQA